MKKPSMRLDPPALTVVRKNLSLYLLLLPGVAYQIGRASCRERV